MNILMMTNTYLPHVGGVARSVAAFSHVYRERGHKVLIAAPEFKGSCDDDENVVRLPAMQNFNGSDFSVVLPIPTKLNSFLEKFKPDIVHSHHPFLVGSTAVRVASQYAIPLVFTHHTLYEHYAPHYIPSNSKRMQSFAKELATRYANLCHHVIAPSESIATLIQNRGVKTPISVIPTGVKLDNFKDANGPAFRQIFKIPRDAYVVGHLGRLAPEKNLAYLADAVMQFIKQHQQCWFLVVGLGPSRTALQKVFADEGLSTRLVCVGHLEQQILASAYAAMDVFAFSSHTETQGMVLAEAMAAGVPVVALDASGTREILRDKKNGRLLCAECKEIDFAAALRWHYQLNQKQKNEMIEEVTATAAKFSLSISAEKALAVYEKVFNEKGKHLYHEHPTWSDLLPIIKSEWDLLKNFSGAAGVALSQQPQDTNNEL